MNKFCVFCGNAPDSKNKEHVIPKWLLRITGDSSRPVFLGTKWNTATLERRSFNLDSFTLPSCTQCNHRFAALEEAASRVVALLLHKRPVGAVDFDIFLDWLDKVRTGLWLAWIYLNDNYQKITPAFHIARRIAAKDRLLVLYNIVDEGQKEIAWFSTDTPVFHLMPSCFGFLINNLAIVNASQLFLLSERVGFPYSRSRYFRDDGGVSLDMQPGKEKIELPLVDRKFRAGGTQLFQPIAAHRALHPHGKQLTHADVAFDCDYVRAHSLDHAAGKGLIFRREKNGVVRYPDAPSLEWLPKQRFSRSELIVDIALMSGEYLEELFLSEASLVRLSDGERERRKANMDDALRWHRMTVDYYRRQKRAFR